MPPPSATRGIYNESEWARQRVPTSMAGPRHKLWPAHDPVRNCHAIGGVVLETDAQSSFSLRQRGRRTS